MVLELGGIGGGGSNALSMRNRKTSNGVMDMHVWVHSNSVRVTGEEWLPGKLLVMWCEPVPWFLVQEACGG